MAAYEISRHVTQVTSCENEVFEILVQRRTLGIVKGFALQGLVASDLIGFLTPHLRGMEKAIGITVLGVTLSPECPCGIHRSRCEYHGGAK